MSNTLTNNAIKLAANPFDLSAPDELRIRAIVQAAAMTKTGAMVFNPVKLTEKVCKEIRSLANHSGNLPTDVFTIVKREVESLPMASLNASISNGFQISRLSREKVKWNYRLKDSIGKVESRLCDSAEQVAKRDATLEKLNEKLKRMERLHRSIKAEKLAQESELKN